MSREFCLEQVARITELERAVAELQKSQSNLLWLGEAKYPIWPPVEQEQTEQDESKYKSCVECVLMDMTMADSDCKYCHDFSQFKLSPKQDKPKEDKCAIAEQILNECPYTACKGKQLLNR
jgi:hypothetical protein